MHNIPPLPIRLRRNRRTEAIRTLIRENSLKPSDLVVPFFIVEGNNQRIPIPSLPGVERLSIDLTLSKADNLHKKGIQAICLFPVIDPSIKSLDAREAWNQEGLLAKAIQKIKHNIPSLCLIADVALDPFTTHGHDGLIDKEGNILNDETIECLIKMSLMQAKAGIDYVAPSDMMDGRIGAIRKALDQAGNTDVGIIAYSVKYASALYTPFRDALNVKLAFGNKKTYQMDPANSREALLECSLDEEEGADILMVKPATFYLDIIAKLRQQTNRPIAAYHVSGEYTMVMAAHEKGFLDARKVFHEALLGIKRAGANLIFTYAADLLLDEM